MDNRTNVILTLLALAMMASAVIAFGCVASSPNNGPLSDDQKTKVESIALNDSFVKGQISSLQFRFFGQQGWTFDPNDPRFFTIGNITIRDFHEVSPGIDRIRALPSVELIVGRQNEGDVNIYIYVDLEKEKVAYVGFTNRSGPHAAGYYFTTGKDGIVEHTEDTSWTIDHDNVTIVDTGYSDGQELTDKEKSDLFRPAKTNSSVREFLASISNNYDLMYHVRSNVYEISGHHYMATYPEIVIQATIASPGKGPKYLALTIDGKRNRILSLEEGEIFFPPPTPPPPPNI